MLQANALRNLPDTEREAKFGSLNMFEYGEPGKPTLQRSRYVTRKAKEGADEEEEELLAGGEVDVPDEGREEHDQDLHDFPDLAIQDEELEEYIPTSAMHEAYYENVSDDEDLLVEIDKAL